MLNILTFFGADKACGGGSFFGMPTWYKYLGSEGTGASCAPVLSGISDIWLILLAVIEILLRISILAAIAYMMYGGIKFITARGNSEKLSAARKTVEDALIGMVIAIVATALISFIAGRFN